MGLRAYFLIDTVPDMDRQDYVNAVREIARMPWVDFVDRVTGPPDIVVMVEAPITVQALANKLSAKPWVKNMLVLRLVSVFERHVTAKVSKAPIFELSGVAAADSETTHAPESVSIYELLDIAGEITETRAYFLIETVPDIDQREFVRAVSEVENTPGVDFVDALIGPPDMAVMVDAITSVQALASEIRAKPWVKNMQVLRLIRLFEPSGVKVSKTPVSEPADKVLAELEPPAVLESVPIYELLGIAKSSP